MGAVWGVWGLGRWPLCVSLVGAVCGMRVVGVVRGGTGRASVCGAWVQCFTLQGRAPPTRADS